MFYLYANKEFPVSEAETDRRPLAAVPRALIVALPPLASCLLLVTVGVWVRERLPDPMATHLSGGTPDGYTSPVTFLAVSTGLLLLVAIVGAACGYLSRTSLRALVGPVVVEYVMLGYLTYLLVALVLVNAHAERGDPANVRFGLYHLLLGLLPAAVVGGVGWLLTRTDAVEAAARGAGQPPAVRLSLARGEAATWTRTVGSRALVVVGLLTTVTGIVLYFLPAVLEATLFCVVGVLLAAFSAIRVTVDRRGVTVASSLVAWPRVQVPLTRIEEATCREVHAIREFGGWGYRMGRRGSSGLVLRSGEALSARLNSGREFVVTVDDAATAAALLNGYIARRHTRSGD